MAKRTKPAKVTNPRSNTSTKGRARAGREANQLGLNAAETAVEGALNAEAAATRASAQAAVQRATQADTADHTPPIPPWTPAAQTPPPPTH